MENTANSFTPSSSNLLSNSAPTTFFNGDTMNEVTESSFSTGFWSILGGILLIIIILAMSGFNIFSYLAIGTQDAANWFQYLADAIKKQTGTLHLSDGLGNVVGVSALGTKEIIDNASKDINYISSSIDNAAETVLDPIIKKTVNLKGTPLTTSSPISNENNSLNRALNTQKVLEGGSSNTENGGSNYNADDSISPIQKTSSGKAGWCYIGDDNGTRTCARVGENQMCMSGDIFPTSEICVNPSLRV